LDEKIGGFFCSPHRLQRINAAQISEATAIKNPLMSLYFHFVRAKLPCYPMAAALL
jgi:hypothetical protein